MHTAIACPYGVIRSGAMGCVVLSHTLWCYGMRSPTQPDDGRRARGQVRPTPYAMPGTDLAYDGLSAYALAYAMSGTELAYGATHLLRDVRPVTAVQRANYHHPLSDSPRYLPYALLPAYAVSACAGTGIAYAWLAAYAISGTDIAYAAILSAGCYQTCCTEPAYGAMESCVLSQRMILWRVVY
eukprot:3940588-Rhodomonas_salina.3